MRKIFRRRSILIALALMPSSVAVRADAGFHVTAAPEAPEAKPPNPLTAAANDGLDFRVLDAAAWGKYNAAFELDKDDAAQPSEKAREWRRVALEAPAFSAMASRRAAQWEAYTARETEASAAKRRRLAARDADWETLRPLLNSAAIPARDKTRWTAEFLNAYSASLGITPGMTPEMAAEAAHSTMRKALGARTLEKNGDIRWVRISSGSFTMGSADTDLSDARPLHRVKVKPFLMAKTLVTNKQYRACVAAGACTAAHVSDGKCFVSSGGVWSKRALPDSFQGDDQPAVCVYWEQARDFSEWLGGRLPTEAEWEYAARSEGKDWKYPWGDAEPTCDRALIKGCGDGTSAPACSRPAGNTLQGLCDMAGDDWEWVQDSYHDSYAGAPANGAAWEVAGSSRVGRGGSVYDGGEKARSAYRNNASETSYLSGFRPVLPIFDLESPEIETETAQAPAPRAPNGVERVQSVKSLAARDSEWKKLKTLLPLGAISEVAKARWSADFTKTYWTSPGLEPVMAEALAPHLNESSLHDAVEARGLTGKAGIQWVKMQDDSFIMGSDDSTSASVRPEHYVLVRAFQLAKTPVTNRQYKECVSTGACTPAKSFGAAFERDDQPVVGVDWRQAKAFSEWAGGRLPTEAEWEEASRSGTDWKYPWSGAVPTCGTDAIVGCGAAATSVVCSRGDLSMSGLCDMAGNVRQWIEDWSHDDYRGAPVSGRAWNSPASAARVVRGASWRDTAEAALSTHRGRSVPGSSLDDLGFRPARSVAPVRAEDAFRVAGATDAPSALAPAVDDGTDFRDQDASVWTEYDAAFELDKSPSAAPAEKARGWRRFAREAPAYAGMAGRRAAQWENFAVRKTEVEKAFAAKARKSGGIQWIAIPGGTFTMGSNDAGPLARPEHRVTIKSFSMAKTLVTNGQYKSCVAAGACSPQHDADGTCWMFLTTELDPDHRRLPDSFRGDDQPAVCVTWDQARKFSAWAGGRLPTEAEWEYAARSTGQDQDYPWGTEQATCDRAATQGCFAVTLPVCSEPAGNTRQGLCDMLGNASEWTEDRFDVSYGKAPADGSAREDSGNYDRVLRGGSFFGPEGVTAYERLRVDPDDCFNAVGFRPVR